MGQGAHHCVLGKLSSAARDANNHRFTQKAMVANSGRVCKLWHRVFPTLEIAPHLWCRLLT